jgi:hypothetical protein
MQLALEALPRRWEPILLSIFGGAVLVAGALIALGLAREGRVLPAPPMLAHPPDRARATASTVAAPPPIVVVPLSPIPTPTSAAAPSRGVEGRFVEARRASGQKAERRRRARHRGARPRGLPIDLTLNPF